MTLSGIEKSAPSLRIVRKITQVALVSLVFHRFSFAQQPADIQHVVAAIEEGRFHGWPANNGAWQWGDEFLVGFTQGDFDVTDGHNIKGKELAKSADIRIGSIRTTLARLRTQLRQCIHTRTVQSG